MKRLVLIGMTVCLCLAGMAMAQTPEMGAPPEMKILKEISGEFDVSFKYRMSPDQPWSETKATAVNTMMLDGCTQMMEFRGDVMGTPMKGINLLSYNRNSKNWQNAWVDNMMGAMSYLEGPMKDGAIVLQGEDHMGGMIVTTRVTQYDMSAEGYKWKMDISMDGGNEWFESASATYARKKASDETDDGGW